MRNEQPAAAISRIKARLRTLRCLADELDERGLFLCAKSIYADCDVIAEQLELLACAAQPGTDDATLVMAAAAEDRRAA